MLQGQITAYGEHADKVQFEKHCKGNIFFVQIKKYVEIMS